MMVPFFPQNLLVFFWTNPLKRSSAFDICLNAFEKDAPWWTRLFISSTFLLLFRQVILCCNNPLKFPWQFCVHSAEIINCNSSDKSQWNRYTWVQCISLAWKTSFTVFRFAWVREKKEQFVVPCRWKFSTMYFVVLALACLVVSANTIDWSQQRIFCKMLHCLTLRKIEAVQLCLQWTHWKVPMEEQGKGNTVLLCGESGPRVRRGWADVNKRMESPRSKMQLLLTVKPFGIAECVGTPFIRDWVENGVLWYKGAFNVKFFSVFCWMEKEKFI